MTRTYKRVTDSRIVVENIPQGLSRYANWVCWRAAEDGDPARRVWLNPRTGRLADTWNIGTWSPLDEALDALERDPTLGGLGYALYEEHGLTAIHIDGCVYSDEERIPSVEATMQVFNTYCEMNPEGDGITMLLKSRKPGHRSLGIDYASGCRVRFHDRHYFVPITGKRMDYLSDAIEDRTQLLIESYDEAFWQNCTTALYSGASSRSSIVPEVILDCSEDYVVGEVVRALACDPELYQQNGYLVHVLEIPDPIRSRATVRRATTHSLRAVIARNVSLLRLDGSQQDFARVPRPSGFFTLSSQPVDGLAFGISARSPKCPCLRQTA